MKVPTQKDAADWESDVGGRRRTRPALGYKWGFFVGLLDFKPSWICTDRVEFGIQRDLRWERDVVDDKNRMDTFSLDFHFWGLTYGLNFFLLDLHSLDLTTWASDSGWLLIGFGHPLLFWINLGSAMRKHQRWDCLFESLESGFIFPVISSRTQ